MLLTALLFVLISSRTAAEPPVCPNAAHCRKKPDSVYIHHGSTLTPAGYIENLDEDNDFGYKDSQVCADNKSISEGEGAKYKAFVSPRPPESFIIIGSQVCLQRDSVIRFRGLLWFSDATVHLTNGTLTFARSGSKPVGIRITERSQRYKTGVYIHNKGLLHVQDSSISSDLIIVQSSSFNVTNSRMTDLRNDMFLDESHGYVMDSDVTVSKIRASPKSHFEFQLSKLNVGEVQLQDGSVFKVMNVRWNSPRKIELGYDSSLVISGKHQVDLVPNPSGTFSPGFLLKSDANVTVLNAGSTQWPSSLVDISVVRNVTCVLDTDQLTDTSESVKDGVWTLNSTTDENGACCLPDLTECTTKFVIPTTTSPPPAVSPSSSTSGHRPPVSSTSPKVITTPNPGLHTEEQTSPITGVESTRKYKKRKEESKDKAKVKFRIHMVVWPILAVCFIAVLIGIGYGQGWDEKFCKRKSQPAVVAAPPELPKKRRSRRSKIGSVEENEDESDESESSTQGMSVPAKMLRQLIHFVNRT